MDQDEFFDYLILQGAVEPAGLDPVTGEMLYSFTDKLKEVNEKMFNKAMDTFHHDITQLWELGFLNINWLDDNPLVTVTEKALHQPSVEALHIDLYRTLQTILQAMKR
jgi:hypothetical protein